jgi:hypothetical protein
MILEFGGGLNENPVPDINEALVGYNFELQKNQSKLRPRRPFDLKGTAPNAATINGLLQLIKRDASETTLVQSGGSIYTWNGAATFTSTATVATTSMLRDAYWSLGDYLVITDVQKATPIKKWDGTNFSTLTTGFSAGIDLYAKYGLVHLGRVWLFNVKTTSDTPHLMVASAFEDPTSYTTAVRASIDSFATGREAFYMLTPDLKPINGATLFHDQLIISTEGGRLFKLTGSSASNFAFSDFYAGSSSTGSESMVNIGNDVMYMRKGGNIESLVATDQFGDVSVDDLSRWIQTTVKDLTGALAVYDQTYQKVLFFVTDQVLVLFKDILLEGRYSPWSVYRTQHDNNFNTNAARYMKKPGETGYSVYFGDSAGRIFDLNGAGTGGDGGAEDISVLRRTRLIDDGVVRPWPWVHKPIEGRVDYRRVGECEITFSVDWKDEYNEASCTVTLKGPGTGDAGSYFGSTVYFGGPVYFSEGFSFAQKSSSRGFSPVGKGPGFFASVTSENKIRYEVDRITLK